MEGHCALAAPSAFPGGAVATRSGRAGNVVFACNALVEPDGMVKVYYGAADACVGLAEMPLTKMVESCYETGRFMR